MKKNIGSVDKIIRILLAGILAGLYFSDNIPQGAGIILLVLAGIVLLTAFISFCPIYYALGISTGGPEKEKDEAYPAE